jgi:hypothetical protein
MHCKLSGKKQTNKKQKSIQLFSIQSPSIPSTTESYLHHLLEVSMLNAFSMDHLLCIQSTALRKKQKNPLTQASIHQSE